RIGRAYAPQGESAEAAVEELDATPAETLYDAADELAVLDAGSRAESNSLAWAGEDASVGIASEDEASEQELDDTLTLLAAAR
ncbi:hypothetical protein, partial [Roseimaritima sediminicola]|uniref:hypothetical protein n=1 Tax=Roseimaritima sediminicola TaxID=2662066 RepID=UPI00138753CF